MLAADQFDYELPPELIAQAPAQRRDGSRLMVVDRSARRCQHRLFSDLPAYLRAGDRLFRNNAAVIPARLHAVRPSGGHVECFLLAPTGEPHTWRCLLRPARKLPPGSLFAHPGGRFSAVVVSRGEAGEAVVRFQLALGKSVLDLADEIGSVPLPPYIGADEGGASLHRERYQTVYADRAHRVAVAAPTAGLHFTGPLLDRLAAEGVTSSNLTLHVGLGTFRPIATAAVEDHPIHRETYELPPDTQAALFPPFAGRRIAVGTTAVRTIEDFRAKHDRPLPEGATCRDEAALFIYPPRRFDGVDVLLTNFHLPRSTLLCLVAAFLTPGSTDGIAWLREIYREAVAERYRFLSYGDAMLIL